ncbi:MAG TPA: hypothetical protein VFN09_02910 [Rhodanobacteraceae bacterium]|nr:hypothetical protein [Rhodanobacteraceae bacterium]
MNDNFETRARALFHGACEQIDPATEARLRSARMAALAAPPPRARRLLLPASALAASALALVVAWQIPGVTTHTSTPAVTGNQASNGSAVADDDVDLYNNLDFYTWLATQPTVAGTGN